MTDRPILFSGPMVRALLDGRKTQTRRPLMLDGDVRGDPYIGGAGNGACALWDDLDGTAYRFPGALGAAVGDRLWVREAWRTAAHLNRFKPSVLPVDSPVFLNADGLGEAHGRTGKLRPSMFMPRWASRITLHVTEVRVQRLHDISEADAIAEGVERVRDAADPHRMSTPEFRVEGACAGVTARDTYAALWDGLNAKRGFGWAANPWVVALTFTVHHQNIDAPGAKEAA